MRLCNVIVYFGGVTISNMANHDTFYKNCDVDFLSTPFMDDSQFFTLPNTVHKYKKNIPTR